VASPAEPPSVPVRGGRRCDDRAAPATGRGPADDRHRGPRHAHRRPRISDNLVVLAPSDAPLEHIVATFVAANAPVRPVVVARTDAASPPTGAELLDWREVPSGGDAAAELWSVDDRLGAGAAYVVDSLSGLAARLGHDAALELFLATCPRLYLRRSIALWPVRADQHPPAVLGRLAAITQVVLHLTEVSDGWQVEVQQAAGRAATTVGRRVVLREGPDGLEPVGTVTSGRERLGATIRAHTHDAGLVTGRARPADRHLPVRVVAGRTGRARTVRRVPDAGVGGPRRAVRADRHAAARLPGRAPGGQPTSRSSGGMTTRTLLDDPTIGGVHRVTLAPRAAGRGPCSTPRARRSWWCSTGWSTSRSAAIR
jgi:hypothetical protein